jgi:hypothetical protein
MTAQVATSGLLLFVYHFAAAMVLLSICGFYVLIAALIVGMPVVETAQALMQWLRVAPYRLGQAVIDLPTKLLRLTVTGGIAIGLIDAIKLERWRIDRERKRALDEIDALRRQAEQRMSQIVEAGTDVTRIQGAQS